MCAASTATSISRKPRKDKKKKAEIMVDLFDRFYTNPETKLYELPKTNRKKKQNIFTSYRPKTGHCLDYNISQTDAKLDAGIVKVNFRETRANYVPVPPEEIPVDEIPVKKKKITYSHAGPPVWEFLDEKWKKKQDVLQAQHRKELKRRLRKSRIEGKKQFTEYHNKILTKVGPEWFQELSPNQLKTVENLKKSLEKDLQDKTIINTKENIGCLGLVLRPNSKKIVRAMQLCRGCPVEFLLVLYQLLEPKRVEYSLNDRLLLSAVVHLTLTETLRELHVRIPSPPRKQKTKPTVLAKKSIRKIYTSPYLEEYTFKKPHRKYTGIYRDKHIQHPESPYFSYLSSLRHEIAASRRIPDDPNAALYNDRREREIISESKLAQKIYNTIHKQKSRFLLKPKIFVPCISVDQLKKLVYPAAKRKIYHAEDDANPIIPIHMAVEVTVTAEYNEENELVDKTCTYSIEYTENPEEKSAQPADTADRADTADTAGKCVEATCGKRSPSENKDKSCMPPCCPCGSRDVGEQSSQVSTCNNCTQTFEEPPPEFVRKVHEETEEKPQKQLETIQSTCSCKEEAIRQLELTRCPCEACLEYRRQQEAQYIISGLKETESGEKIPVISSAVGEKICECMYVYKKKIEKLEDYRKRMKAKQEVKSAPDKYVIGGVVNGPEGPIYVISGVRHFANCKCARAVHDEMKEQERLAAMPEPPKGRVTYGITGMRKTSQGHVFVLSEALPIEPCECEKLYEKYAEKHSECIKMYEDYLRQIKEDINEYMLEMEKCSRKESRRSSQAVPEDSKLSVSGSQTSKGEHSEDIDVDLEGGRCSPDRDPLDSEEQAPTKVEEQTSSPAEILPPAPQEAFQATPQIEENVLVESPKVEEKQAEESKHEGEIKEEGEKDVGVGEDDVFESEMDLKITVENAMDEMMELKRFTILKKIPCDEKVYKKIVRKTLKTMAEDSYPLAKLPNCHMLPIFRLWMQMRCGMTWNKSDKLDFVQKSIIEWKSIHKCYGTVKQPSLPFTEEQGEKYTWREFAQVDRIAGGIKTKTYRKIRQSQINYGREFFPTLFQYEIPSKYFRDCYFAYTPSKEEESIVYNIWEPHDTRTFSKRKSCLCKR